MCWRICSASSASEHAPTGPGRPAIVFGGVSLRERYTLAREIFHTRATRARNSEPRRARVSGSSSRPPVGQRAFTLQRLDLGVEQFVVHGDLAHLGFQPADLVVAVIALAFFPGCGRACERTPRHSVSLAIETFVFRATR